MGEDVASQKSIARFRRRQQRYCEGRRSFSPLAFTAAAIVKAANKPRERRMENVADPQECCHGDGAASLDLLPVAGGEAERDHIFLGQAPTLAQVPNAFA